MASSAVNKNNIDKPKEIINGEIFAFSYFFDRASEAGLIDAENGGKTKGTSFIENCPAIIRTVNWPKIGLKPKILFQTQ